MIKLNIGCAWRNFGEDWVHLDGGDYDHLDYKDITKLEFDDNTVDLIYASHVLEYFDREQVVSVLQEWHRTLKPNSEIRIAVPDFQSMANLYINEDFELSEFLGPLYGKMKMGNDIIYHKTTYDFNSIKLLLEQVGFTNIERYDWKQIKVHVDNDDHSQAYKPNMDKENGTLISLNVRAKKK